MDLAGVGTERTPKKHFTVAVTGKHTALETDAEFDRKCDRSTTLPTNQKRGDYEISANDLQELKKRAEAFKGRVRRGSIFLGTINEKELLMKWESDPDVKVHMHGKLSQSHNQNIPGIERDIAVFKGKIEDIAKQYKFVHSCIKGCKGYGDTSQNQDNFSFTVYEDWEILVVMDGHGMCGHDVSRRVVETLPYYLIRSPFFLEGDIEPALKECFELSSKDLLGYAVEQDFDVQASGSTCLLLLKKGDQYWTAHVGDSRLIVGYETSAKELVFETQDHKPGCPGEKERIEANAGEIRTLRYEDFTVDRIFVAGCDFPGLCMSRSFGDECVKAHGVISEPEVSGPLKLDLSKKPFLLAASDGVWEFIESAWCIKAIVRKLAIETPEKIVQKLAKESRRRWKEEEGDYCDDITLCLLQT